MILDKLKIEVTKDPIHPVGRNGEHFIKSIQHMDILHAFINYVRATANHGLSPSEVDWGDPKGEHTKMLKYISDGCMLMEVDWGGNLKLNYTSCGCMHMEVEWGGKLIVHCMVDWGAHGTYPNGHNISEIDWGAHDSSFFLFLVNIDPDAKPKDFFTQ